MHGDGIRARLEESGHEMIGVFDHEMDVEREICLFSHGRDHGGPERNVINEVAIHDVEMEPIRAGFLGATNLGFEMGEVSREDGRGDEDLWRGHNRNKRRTRNAERPTPNQGTRRPLFAWASSCITSFPLTWRESVPRYYRFQPVVNALARMVLCGSQPGRVSDRLDNAF